MRIFAIRFQIRATMNPRYASFLLAALTLGSAYSQSGTLDPTYGNAGISILQPGDFHDVTHDVIALDDNTSLICGVARVDGRNSILIAHLLEDGSLDAGFGTNAGYTFFTIGEEAYGYAMGRDSQGNIYVTGIAYPTFAQAVVPLVKTDASGMPDASFGDNGVITFALSDSEAEARGLAIIPGDRIMLGGSLIDAGFDRDAFIMRVMPDGTPDATFGDNGVAVNTSHEGEDLITCLTVMENGNTVGAGYADESFVMKTFLFMVDGFGFPENGFGTSGQLLPAIGTGNHAAWGITASGTTMCLTGWADSPSGTDLVVASIRSDGFFNPAFSTDGIHTLDVNPIDNGLDIKQYVNGDFIVCGTTGEPGFGTPRDFIVARFTSAGDAVMSFGTNGATVTSIQADFDDANALAIQPDGKLLLAGFTAGFSTGGDNDVAVARYNVDWTLGADSQMSFSTAVHPNPSTGDLITVKHSGNAAAQVVLLDALGREARSFQIIQPDSHANLSVAGLAGGRYTLRLQCAGQVMHHALVIAR